MFKNHYFKYYYKEPEQIVKRTLYFDPVPSGGKELYILVRI